ncbi:MAG: DUF3299 domain-containing protein [Planctomycetota bacterium]|nr:DUF3299 domain-containing protein [Planctomycetota bacterium]
MRLLNTVLACALVALSSCGDQAMELGPEILEFEGAAIDSAPEKQAGPIEKVIEITKSGFRKLGFPDLSLEELGEDGVEDLLDALLYPDESTEEELAFPDHVQELDDTQVALRGYMIPNVQKDGKVTEFMLVADLLSCCFGGAPTPDQWVDVKMVDGNTSEYFAFVPIRVKGRFWLQVIEDEAGYASGCFHIDGVEVEREP